VGNDHLSYEVTYDNDSSKIEPNTEGGYLTLKINDENP
jgi:hypothetical protein